MTRKSWFDPNDHSLSVIRPELQYGSELKLPPKLLMIFAEQVLGDLKDELDLYTYPERFTFFGGGCEFYKIRGNRLIGFIEGTIGAPIGASALDTAIAKGVVEVFILGLCGAVSSELKVGDLVIPTEVSREEGTSFHYAPPEISARPDSSTLLKLQSAISETEFTVHTGKTVSTDAPYRQTINTEIGWREAGILGVDMEMSALFTVAKYREIPAIGVFVVSDAHDLTGMNDWEWNRSLFRESVRSAVVFLSNFAQES